MTSSTDGRSFASHDTAGYVGFANLPNQVHRKSVKKGFEFTLMVVGESGLGKSTLINSLFLTDLYPDRQLPSAAENAKKKTIQIDASTVEIEERGVKLRLTVVDTPGFGDAMDNTDSFQQIIRYIDEQFERYLRDESGLNRKNIIDNRVHCCFYFINPYGRGLKPLDLEVMKQLSNKVSIVPVIAKADCLTQKEISQLKKTILGEIKEHGIKVYTLPECDSDEDEDFKKQVQQLRESMPFAVVGANAMVEIKGKKMRGRQYPWGIVEVENPAHCDFVKLRTMLITHMQDLQEVTHDVHYENFRSERLARQNAAGSNSTKERHQQQGASMISLNTSETEDEKERKLREKDAELKRMQEMVAAMQEQIKQQSQTSLPSLANSAASSRF
jgi:septin 2